MFRKRLQQKALKWSNMRITCVLGVVLALSFPGYSQTLGQITGLVTDPNGSIIVGATVTVTNSQTNVSRKTTTNSAGNYAFPALLPDVYNVKAEMFGFKGEAHAGVELQVAQIARIDFHLQIGSVTQTVEVSGGAPLLTTESATVGTVIDNDRIVGLPLNGRSFTSLIALSPNVAYNSVASGGQASARQGGDRTTQEIFVAGARREYTAVEVAVASAREHLGFPLGQIRLHREIGLGELERCFVVGLSHGCDGRRQT